MGLHKPFDRTFSLIGGAVMTNGFSLNLVKGQFGIFDTQSTSVNGTKAVSSFNGKPNAIYELKLGKSDLPVTRSQNNKSFSSFPFKVSQVLDLQVSVPESTTQKVDEVIIGYNGIDDNTAMTFKKGQVKKIVLRLEGEAIGMLGYEYGVDIPVYIDVDACPVFGTDCADCDPCENVDCLPLVLEAVEKLKRHQLRGGTKVSDYVDITPVRECDTTPTETLTEYNFYCLEVCDTGDDSALALVQAQYPTLKVVRTGRDGAISKYQVIKTNSVPADYEPTLPSIIKGCTACPVGYTEDAGGLIYAVTLEDDGIDESATIETLANASVGTAIKADSQNAGVGYYTVVLTTELSDANFNTFIAANPTATITFVGSTASICNAPALDAISWTACGTCNVAERDFTIDLPDTECGNNRLAELQSAFPNLTISLEGTTGGCQTRYITTVPTNMVCDDCDAIFNDYFTADAPASFDGREWTAVAVTASTGCKCGIKVKGKVLEVHPDECLRDTIGFVDSAVKIQISGGHLTEVREGIGETVDNPFHVEYKSRYARRTHLGGNLWNDEDRSRVFFTGEQRHLDNVAKLLKGEESHLTSDKQYVDYAITIRRTHYSQSFSGTENETITYHILAEVGRHQAVEALLNSLATAANLTPVKAFGA